jgi:hypothetical protein
MGDEWLQPCCPWFSFHLNLTTVFVHGFLLILTALQIVYIINLIIISIMGTIDLKCNIYCASALLVHLTIHR